MRSLQEEMAYGNLYWTPSLNKGGYYTTFIYVIGCGGTGSRLIPLLARHIQVHNEQLSLFGTNNNLKFKGRLELVLVDDGPENAIEPKNLRRQDFFPFEVGECKAEAMAKRMSCLYGIDVKFINQRIDKNFKFNPQFTNGDSYKQFIVFDCLDNKVARMDIENSLMSSAGSGYVLVSCGNEEKFGQVIMSGPRDSFYNCFNFLKNRLGKMINDRSQSARLRAPFLPSMISLYKGFKDSGTVSCADMQFVNDQSMPINNLVASIAFNFFYKIMAGEDFDYNIIKCDIDNNYTKEYFSHPLDYKKLLHRFLFGEYSNLTEEMAKENLGYSISGLEADKLYEKYSFRCLEFFKTMNGYSLNSVNEYIKKIEEYYASL